MLNDINYCSDFNKGVWSWYLDYFCSMSFSASTKDECSNLVCSTQVAFYYFNILNYV